MINSFVLHILAMIFMTCDHLWGADILNWNELTWIGRLSFPIFAFMIVEGYRKTSDYNRYKKRLFILALISEIPFNMLYSGIPIYPFHQNVIWTFLIGLMCINKIETIKKENKKEKTLILGILFIVLGALAAKILMTDYYEYGIITMFVFYFLKSKWLQALGIIFINVIWMKGLEVPLQIGNYVLNIKQQSLAILSLIPIFLYNGKQGFYNKVIRRVYYLYYPIHMLIFSLI